jgi:hypothetical protein
MEEDPWLSDTTMGPGGHYRHQQMIVLTPAKAMEIQENWPVRSQDLISPKAHERKKTETCDNKLKVGV